MLLYAMDELEMCTLRLHLRAPGERVKPQEALYKLHPAEVPVKNVVSPPIAARARTGRHFLCAATRSLTDSGFSGECPHPHWVTGYSTKIYKDFKANILTPETVHCETEGVVLHRL